MARNAKEVAVPHVEQTHKRNGVLLERRVGEVVVDGVEASEELLEALGAKDHDKRETHSGVNGVTAADPAPETESVLRVDAEIGNEVKRRGDGNEVLLDSLGLALVGAIDGTGSLEAVEHPCAHLTSVRECLERSERLGHDDDERRLRIEATDLLGHIVRVDVGDVAAVDTGISQRLEGLVHHDRAKVGATDTDRDEMLDALSGYALPLTGTNLLGKGVHLVELSAHVGNAVLVAVEDRANLVGRTTEGGMENSAVLGRVDMDAGIHLVAALLDLDLAREVDEQLDRLVSDEVLGEIEAQIVDVERQLLNTLVVGCEPVFKADSLLGKLVVVVLQGCPSSGLGRVDRSGYCHARSSSIRLNPTGPDAPLC